MRSVSILTAIARSPLKKALCAGYRLTVCLNGSNTCQAATESSEHDEQAIIQPDLAESFSSRRAASGGYSVYCIATLRATWTVYRPSPARYISSRHCRLFAAHDRNGLPRFDPF